MKERRRVCFYCSQIYAMASRKVGGFGGAEVDLWNVLRELSRHDDLDVVAVATTRDIVSEVRVEGVRIVPVAPCNVTESDSLLLRRLAMLAYCWRLFRVLWQCRAEAYVTKLVCLETALVRMCALLRGARFGFRIEHDWETSRSEMTTRLLRGSSLVAKLVIASLRSASFVISQTATQQDALRKNLGVGSTIVRNAHVVSELSGDLSRKTEVLWVARFHPMKRPLDFVALAKRLPHRSFTMVVAPVPEYERLFTQLRESAAGLRNFRLIEGLAPEALVEYYERARIFVLTSDAEGFPNVAIEAMKTATPIVSLCLSLDSLLMPFRSEPAGLQPADAPVGFVADGSLDSLERLVELMYLDDEVWSQCGASARRLVEKTFDVVAIADEYKALMFGHAPRSRGRPTTETT